jgi:hypothetical protein
MKVKLEALAAEGDDLVVLATVTWTLYWSTDYVLRMEYGPYIWTRATNRDYRRMTDERGKRRGPLLLL